MAHLELVTYVIVGDNEKKLSISHSEGIAEICLNEREIFRMDVENLEETCKLVLKNIKQIKR